jgi:hypothetical protein
MTAIAVLASAAPTVLTSKTVPLHPVADTFDLAILEGALGVLSETDWVQGVDEMAQIGQLANDLASDVLLIADGVRDDDVIRTRATATLRRLSAKYRRDRTAGLATSPAWLDVAPLDAPDLVQSRT